MRFIRNNALSLLFALLFLSALVGQAFAGHAEENEQLMQHGQPPVGFGEFIFSSQFLVDVAENWQSEYLQFSLFIFVTIWLVQRGSPESKELGKEGLETDREQRVRGQVSFVYSNSLVLVMLTIWIGSWFAQSITGLTQFNADRFDHHQDAISWSSYIVNAHFWEQTLQNWQSEFLAIASMAILAVYLRQRGSPESKPVGAPHDATGVEG